MRTPGTSSIHEIGVIGAGGAIGSHLVPHLARMTEVAGLTVVDPDRHDSERNLAAQAIDASDLGRDKVRVLEDRIRRIRPDVKVRAIRSRVEDVPLGLLRADLIVACLDSRAARQTVNQVAWRLGVPWLDAGVESDGLLVRVGAYVPGPDSACLECAWDQRHYDQLEQAYPCAGETGEAPATNAPSALGGLAAAFLAIEARKILSGQRDRALVGRQIILDATWHRQQVAVLPRRNCRFDHEVYEVRRSSRPLRDLTIDRALDLSPTARGSDRPSFRVEGEVFVHALTCPECGRRRCVLRLSRRLTRRQRRCPGCGTAMLAAGTDTTSHLEPARLERRLLRRPLSALGLRRGDVLTLREASGESHFELE